MATTYSCILVGLDVIEIEIETIVGTGFCGLTILGLKGDITRDMRERIRSALESVGIPIPAKRVVVNISSQEILKLSRTPLQELDFAVAACIIISLFQDQGITLSHKGKEFFAGELTLTGQLKPVQNTLVYEKIYMENKNEISFSLPNSCFFKSKPFDTFSSLESWISERKNHKKQVRCTSISHQKNNFILSENDEHNAISTLKLLLKNPKAAVAVLIAIAGQHHLLLAGEPGIGKSFAIQNIQNFFMELPPEKQIEVKLIHGNQLCSKRPFRSPHHSSSTAALIGGQTLKPGEVTLAHHGVLFLDEISEFSRQALEALREPLDSHRVELSKSAGSMSYPANFLLCATTNPCACGYFLSFNKTCRCNPINAKSYMRKISGPLLDRFCLQVWMQNQEEYFEDENDIFSTYLANLKEPELFIFIKNFFDVQFESISAYKKLNIKLDFANKNLSLRAQNKIAQLNHTFSKLFPSLCHHENFNFEVLKYRNLTQIMNKVFI